MKIISVYDLSYNLMKELYIKEGEELNLFEGDPDILRLKDEEERPFYPLYFTEYKNKIITSEDVNRLSSEFNLDVENLLKDFFGERKHRESLEKQNRESFRNCEKTKIQYRGGIGYVYSLYELKD